MNAVKEQLEIMLEKFKEGHLAETDIESALLLADDTEVSPRQSLLYMQVPTTHPYAAVIGISIFEEGKDMDGLDKNGNFLYTSIKNALDDGWRIIKFPEMSLAMNEQDTYGLGYEFVLERWR